MPTDPTALPPFDGWDTPRYTPVPDQLFDEWLPHLSEAELKVLLYIMRRTFGFKKNADAISLSQLRDGIVRRDGTRLDGGAGVSESSILRAVKGLREKGLIETTRLTMPDGGDATTIYRLQMKGTVKLMDPAPQFDGPVAVNLTAPRPANSGTQETVVQETVQEEGLSPALAELNRRYQEAERRRQGA